MSTVLPVGVCDHDRRLVEIHPSNISPAISYFKRRRSEGAVDGVFVRGSGYEALDFLRELTDIERLAVDASGPNSSPLSLAVIGELTTLRGLRSVNSKKPIDFSQLRGLRFLSVGWAQQHRGLSNLINLEELAFWGFNPSEGDMTSLPPFPRLLTLRMIRTNCLSSRGIERLAQVNTVEFSYAAKLTDISSLAELNQTLRNLTLANVKSIGEYTPLGKLQKLRFLSAYKCAPIPTISFVRELQQLEYLGLVDTEIEDRQLEPLLKLPSLVRVGIVTRQRYDFTEQQINDALKERHHTRPYVAETSTTPDSV